MDQIHGGAIAQARDRTSKTVRLLLLLFPRVRAPPPRTDVYTHGHIRTGDTNGYGTVRYTREGEVGCCKRAGCTAAYARRCQQRASGADWRTQRPTNRKQPRKVAEVCSTRCEHTKCSALAVDLPRLGDLASPLPFSGAGARSTAVRSLDEAPTHDGVGLLCPSEHSTR